MDRGVSDVLGYVLIFSLITASVGLVYTSGYGALNDARNAERFNNAERAFDVLDSNIDDVVFGHSPSRATELKLSDATIGYGEPVVVNISLDTGESLQTRLDPVVFAIGDDRELVYSNGAVIRTDGSNSVMRSEPRIRFGDRTMISIIETRSRSQAISGSSRVLIRTVASTQDVYNYTDASGYEVTLNVTTERTDAWKRYLETETGNDCTVSGGTVTCSYEADSVFVQVSTLDVFLI